MNHTHSTEEKKAIVNRLLKVSGHIDAIIKMVEGDRDCSDVLVQLAAVKSAINNTGKIVLKHHIEHCIVEAIENDDKDSIDKLNSAINSFIK